LLGLFFEKAEFTDAGIIDQQVNTGWLDGLACITQALASVYVTNVYSDRHMGMAAQVIQQLHELLLVPGDQNQLRSFGIEFFSDGASNTATRTDEYDCFIF